MRVLMLMIGCGTGRTERRERRRGRRKPVVSEDRSEEGKTATATNKEVDDVVVGEDDGRWTMDDRRWRDWTETGTDRRRKRTMKTETLDRGGGLLLLSWLLAVMVVMAVVCSEEKKSRRGEIQEAEEVRW